VTQRVSVLHVSPYVALATFITQFPNNPRILSEVTVSTTHLR